MESLKKKLEELNEKDIYPFHMPGHKRSNEAGIMAGYFDIDITEIDDYDNLHDAEGIILDAEKRANRLYGADETHFLVNGSSCGILSAISCAVSEGGTILAGRNCHRSMFNTAYLKNLSIDFLIPENRIISKDRNIMVPGIITPDFVRKAFEKNRDIEAVFITSPTYEGFSSDVEEIARIAHENDAILIVDAAHGAHFGLDKRLPRNAVSQGADIVIHSVHKTLAAMTQTALIHVKGNRVNIDRLRRYLRIYQSSSPSYVLMASIDSAMEDIERRGEEVFSKLLYYREKVEKLLNDTEYIKVYGIRENDDPGKLLIYSKEPGITGQMIYDILRIEYGLALEMAGDGYALAIITGYDSEDGIMRLIDAVRKIDDEIKAGSLDKYLDKNNDKCFENKTISEKSKDPEFSDLGAGGKITLPKKVMSLKAAWDTESEKVVLDEASGRVAGDFVNLYPPGIPLIIPGEEISNSLIFEIKRYINEGYNVQGICEGKEYMITCVKK
ncbi:MAG: aminotransferase class V-fold PLP-dependent enzyme [Butyrivibrio sp.]|nr:aminotransferase class V-fold PLP-dependent enzyme [Butyrivibrio sp.]